MSAHINQYVKFNIAFFPLNISKYVIAAVVADVDDTTS